MGRHYTTIEIKTIRELAKTMTAAQIGKRIKRDVSSIYSVAGRHGIKFEVGHDKRFTDEQVTQVIRMRNQGLMFREIALVPGLKATSCANLYRLRA